MAERGRMARDTITGSEKALVDVFCDRFHFSIPDYQRPYSWTTEEAAALFDDLRTAMGTGDPREASPYFMGSIVLIKDPEESEADVVDGQQRLTTLTILICVLRDRLNGKQDKEAQEYIFEEGKPTKGTQDRYRLRLRGRDAHFLETKIQREGATNSLPDADQIQGDAKINIVKNARLLAKRVDKIEPDERLKLLSFMIQRCFLVVVEASHRDSAYRVFSVLNDRGLNLSPTDILKAEILGAIEEAQGRTYTEIWEEIEESLGRDRFRDLFAHIRMIHHPVKLAETLVAEFRRHVIDVIAEIDQRPERATEFIDQTLEPMSEAYLWIVNQDFPGEEAAESINRSLRHLALLDNVDWQPPTILFLSQFREQHERVVKFLSALDALAYGMFICRDSVNRRIARYADIIQKIKSGGDVLGDGSPIYLSDEQKTEVLTQLDGPVYEIPRIRLPILLRLDEAVADSAANYDHRNMSIEHVLPQNPAEDSEWMTLFDEAERGYWTHRLANLVLLSTRTNSRAKNDPFKIKKEAYFAPNGICTFALTSQVLLTDNWTPAHLAKRQEALLETCQKIWNLAPAR